MNPFESKWYWLLKAMQVYGTKAQILVNSEAMLRSLDEQATQNCVYEGQSGVLFVLTAGGQRGEKRERRADYG